MTRHELQGGRFPEEAVITFPRGLVGLPDLKRWILVDMDPPLPMKWLQSLDREGFRLPVVEPGYYAEDYDVTLDAESEGVLACGESDDLVVMIISTITAGGSSITGNLSAPLVVNLRNRRGVQAILADGDYPLRQEIDHARFGAAVAASLASTQTGRSAGSGAGTGDRDAERAPELVDVP